MRFPFATPHKLTARLSLLAAVALAGCTAKEQVEPGETACNTAATVRFCPGKTLICPTEHTTLVLADGTRLQPTGPVWEAYLAHQTDGESLYIGYTITGAATNGAPADASATLNCLNPTTR